MKIANICIIILILILLFVHIQDVYALKDEDIVWSDGSTYVLRPEEDTVTEKEYTIKVIDLPPPVRGITMEGKTRPEKNVTRFATFDLYKDIINNSNPIERFTLEVDDYYITPDKELKITINDMPKGDSQSWVYEYYKPSVSINVQKRSIPKIDIQIKLKDTNESTIDPKDTFKTEIRIKNIGNDSALDVNYNIDIGSLKLIQSNQSLIDTISRLDKEQIKVIWLTLEVPISIEENVYIINVSASGHDIKDTEYYWNFSRNLTSRHIIRSINVNKSTKNTYYMKENVSVILDIANIGPLNMDNIKLYDSVPFGSKLSFVRGDIYKGEFKDDGTELLANKSILRPGESWVVTYILTPREPGVYLLPRFRINFSIQGKDFDLISEEKGFRVFGPKLVINKSIMNKGNDVIDIIIRAKNIGNGLAARAYIDDKLPENAVLLIGKTNLTTSIDADEEKTMSYTVKISAFKGINSTIWPPANVTYWLDDYKFTTSSDENVTEEIMPQELVIQTPEITVPVPNEKVSEKSEKRVVATISKTPLVPVKKKETSGFRFYELYIVLILLMILTKKIIK